MLAFPQNFECEAARVLPADEVQALRFAMSEGSLPAICLNPKKPLPKKALLDFEVGDCIPWNPDGRYVVDGQPGKSIYHKIGAFYVQEAAAQLSATLVDIPADARVLDLCAAPGGKTAQLAARMDGGMLVANDPSASRASALVRNIERMGFTNVAVTCAAPRKLAAHFGEFFQVILVDAPCSGWGMLRRGGLSKSSPDACARVQGEILQHAASMLLPGGQLIYSTCTIPWKENEGVIEGFLEAHPNFILGEAYSAMQGISTSVEGICMGRAIRIWPHRSPGDSFFAAKLIKDGCVQPKAQRGVKKPAPREFLDFWHVNFQGEPPIGSYEVCGTELYFQAASLSLHGIHTRRSGWHLGSLRSERFVPSGAFGRGAYTSSARYVLNVGERDAALFLSGGMPDIDDGISRIPHRAYALMCFESLPLGFAQMVGGRLKSKLPRGWVS